MTYKGGILCDDSFHIVITLICYLMGINTSRNETGNEMKQEILYKFYVVIIIIINKI